MDHIPRNAPGTKSEGSSHSHRGRKKGRGRSRGGGANGAVSGAALALEPNGTEQAGHIGHVFLQYPDEQLLSQLDGKQTMQDGAEQHRQLMEQMMAEQQMAYQHQNPAEMMQMHRHGMGMLPPGAIPHPSQLPPGMMQMSGGWNMGPGVPGPVMMMALHQVMQTSQHPGQPVPPMQPAFQTPHPHPHPHAQGPGGPGGPPGGQHQHGVPGAPPLLVPHPHAHPHAHPLPLPPQGQPPHSHPPRFHGPPGHYGGKGFGGQRRQPAGSMAMRALVEMRNEDLLRASSPMLTRILVDMLRESDDGNARAWHFFERLCALSKADVYQHSVMLNACANSWAAETLMRRMEAANVQPSEVTYQKLYKIYLRDARVEEAEQVLEKMRAMMYADGAAGLPDDYTNRVLTDMLLEMVKEGHHSERRAWELFNRLRGTNKVNVIHYNVMLNTCKTTQQAVQLVQQARKAGIQPSDRTCLKLAKMYIKEGNLPSHPGQLDAVMKGLKKTSLFAPFGRTHDALAGGEGDLPGGEDQKEEAEAEAEDEVARLLQRLLIPQYDGADESAPPIPPVGCSPPDLAA